MVCSYIGKSTCATKYCKSNLKRAVDNIKRDTLIYMAALKMYNVPRPIVYASISKGKQGIKSNSMGWAATLSSDNEKPLFELLKIMEKYGYGLSRRKVLNSVGDFLNTNKIKNLFNKGFLLKIGL